MILSPKSNEATKFLKKGWNCTSPLPSPVSYFNSPWITHLPFLPSFLPRCPHGHQILVWLRDERWPLGAFVVYLLLSARVGDSYLWLGSNYHPTSSVHTPSSSLLTRSMALCCCGGVLRLHPHSAHRWMIDVGKILKNNKCVCVSVRSLPPWTTWLSCMGREESTRKRSLCARERWRSEKRWVKGQTPWQSRTCQQI